MRDIGKIRNSKEAAQLLQMCEMGKAYVIKTYMKDEPQYVVCMRSGRELPIVGDRYRHEFMQFFNSHGAGDGLFPGCDQATAR